MKSRSYFVIRLITNEAIPPEELQKLVNKNMLKIAGVKEARTEILTDKLFLDDPIPLEDRIAKLCPPPPKEEPVPEVPAASVPEAGKKSRRAGSARKK